MRSLIESIADRFIGTVEEVSADRLSVIVDAAAPQAVALNTGSPQGFPRVNSYLLIPNEVGATIGLIASLRVEHLQESKHAVRQDRQLVDLPHASRVITLIPLGTLVQRVDRETGTCSLEVRRGVEVFPSVGDPVLLPTPDQLRAAVEGDTNVHGRIQIGRCPTAGDAPIFVDPDRIFGRHLAVLGNTGAGKSCSVAGLIRWSLEAANRERDRLGHPGRANARFIVLDPNGEYAQAFADLPDIRLFQVGATGGAKPLKVPAWLWNGEEWAAFTNASPGVQRPILFDALRHLRSGDEGPDPFMAKVRRRVRLYRERLRKILEDGDYMEKGKREECAEVLINLQKDFEDLAKDPACSQEGLSQKLTQVAENASILERCARNGRRKEDPSRYWHNDFCETDIDERIQKLLLEIAGQIGLSDESAAVGEDTPKPFHIEDLPIWVDVLASDSSSRDMAQFVDSLNLRIRSLIQKEGLAPVLNPANSESIRLEDWLGDYIGADNATNGQVAIVDLSLVPSEAIHIVIAVLARLIFEALQRYRRQTGKELPTVLVLEEAHTFIHKDLLIEGAYAAGRTCCRVFDRIAREGRKFGLGLVLASQRPSELSPTVLSQCNTFLLHRLVNGQDQDLVRRLVPDGISDLLRELPSLPSRQAIVVGWAVPAPVLVEIRELPENQRPHSPDPDFWDVWTGDPKKGQRPIDWTIVASPWSGRGSDHAKAENVQKSQPDQPSDSPGIPAKLGEVATAEKDGST